MTAGRSPLLNGCTRSNRVHPLSGGPHRPRVGGTNDWQLEADIFEISSLPAGLVPVEVMTVGYESCTLPAFSRGPTGTGPVETCIRMCCWLAFSRAPTDAGSVESGL